MGGLLPSGDDGGGHVRVGPQPVYGYGSGLRAAVEAGAASGAAFSGVSRRMYAVLAEFRCEFQAAGRAGIHTQPATFAFLNIDRYVTAWWCRHVVLAGHLFPGHCAETSAGFHSTGTTRCGTSGGRSE